MVNPLATHMNRYRSMTVIFRAAMPAGQPGNRTGVAPGPLGKTVVLSPAEVTAVDIPFLSPEASLSWSPLPPAANPQPSAPPPAEKPTTPLDRRLQAIMDRHREKAARDGSEIIPTPAALTPPATPVVQRQGAPDVVPAARVTDAPEARIQETAGSPGLPLRQSPDGKILNTAARPSGLQREPVPSKQINQRPRLGTAAPVIDTPVPEAKPAPEPKITPPPGPENIVQRFSGLSLPEMPGLPGVGDRIAEGVNNAGSNLSPLLADIPGGPEMAGSLSNYPEAAEPLLTSLASDLDPEKVIEGAVALDKVNTVADQLPDPKRLEEVVSVLLPAMPALPGMDVLPELLTDGASDLTERVGQQPQPLQESWPVQTIPDAETGVSNFVNQAAAHLPADRVALTQVTELLRTVPTGQPTDSGVPLLRPRLPRPTPSVAGLLPEALSLPELLRPTPELHSPLPDVSQALTGATTVDDMADLGTAFANDAMAVIPTEVGNLPPDLWNLVGASPPLPDGLLPETAVQDLAQIGINQTQDALNSLGLPQIPPLPNLKDAVALEPGAGLPPPTVDALVRRLYRELQTQLAVEWERIRGRYE